MRIDVYCSSIPNSAELSRLTIRRMEGALERFADRIDSVQVRLEDVNGPRGGTDAGGRCVVELTGLRPVVISDRAESFREVVDALVKRASHTVSRRISRRHTLRSTGPALSEVLAEAG